MRLSGRLKIGVVQALIAMGIAMGIEMGIERAG